MNLMLKPELKPSQTRLSYADKAMLTGSCFSDNIGAKLQQAKFQVLFNPTGIVFDPLSMAKHLEDSANQYLYKESDVFLFQELWHSWYHHSDFSTTDQQATIDGINGAIRQSHDYLKSASFLFITLGTAYSYQLKEEKMAVANCHKVPKERFDKKLLSIGEITEALRKGISAVRKLNPTLTIVFTVSPVKHIRDGIVENNRSKARLIEAAHQLTETEQQCSYFPAYELVTDILRDYRFYATDMAHPNEQAIEYVFNHFCETYFSTETEQLLEEVKQIVAAKNHKPLHPQTQAHKEFLKLIGKKLALAQQKLPMLNWEEEREYFNVP